MLQNIHKGQGRVSGDLLMLYLRIVLGFLAIQVITFTHTKNQGLFKSKKRTRETAQCKAHGIRKAGGPGSPVPAAQPCWVSACLQKLRGFAGGEHTLLCMYEEHIYAKFWKNLILTISFFYYPGEGNE